MLKYDKLIFVDTDNTSRGPMAEALFHRLKGDLPIEVVSRGLVVHFTEPINPKVCVVMQNNEMDVSEYCAIQFQEQECSDTTLLLAMTTKQKETLVTMDDLSGSVYTLKEYAGLEGDVMDPYGGSLIDYENCFDELSKLVKKTVYRINEEEI